MKEYPIKSYVKRASPPPYKIIYNWDGAPLGYSEYPQSEEQFLEKVYAPIKDTQVGALFWCIGVHEAEWPSETMEVVGDSVNRVYDSVNGMRHAENIRAMFERGENPYAAMVQRGHDMEIDVFTSIRMNDQHFWDIQNLEEMTKVVRGGLMQMRKAHPEWCLGDEAPGWCTTSWNMAVPEVRAHRLQHITEACRLADWDGVELDWQRHAFHLPENDAYRLRYVLTDLQRAVRQMTDEIAQARGRPFYVAVRIGTTMEACRRIGYDVETWAKEGLCDIVIPAGNSGTDPGIEVEAFAEVLKATGIKLYGGFDSDGRQQAQRLVSVSAWREAWFRAVAKGYFDRGADGIYVFNWHANDKTRRALLTTIGAPKTLEGRNKIYAAVHRSIASKGGLRGDAERDDRIYGETPVTLYRTLSGDGPTFHVPVHDNVVEEAKGGRLESVVLQIEFAHFSPADKVVVRLDGQDLGPPVAYNAAAEDPNDPSDVSENSWLVWELSPEQVALNPNLIGGDWGPHEIQVCLVERNPRLKVPLVVQHVEIYVNYNA
jgi:hypothetical protein